MVNFLARNGFNSFWYAPKSDVSLRKHWQTEWDKVTFSSLLVFREHCLNSNVRFGIGFSPLGLYSDWREGQGREQLRKRLVQVNELRPDGLAILFDDMQGDLPSLAQTQIEIIHFIKAHSDINQLVLCPTYYSFDPVLEELFGKQPENYWRDLGRHLDSGIDVFWTGDKVISKSYQNESLDKITSLLQRKPLIWDNSIVNDGKKTSPFLTLKPMFNMEFIAPHVRGVVINPMNAPALSEIPLASLLFQGSDDERFAQALDYIAPELGCLELFVVKGWDNLTESEQNKIKHNFQDLSHPVAQEVLSWLAGNYQFDPACLT